MKTLLVIILFITSISYSQTNVVVALQGTISGEPKLEDSFIAGYESIGGTFNGTFTILENTSVNTAMAYAQTNGQTLVLRNTGTSTTTSKQIDSFYNQGIQFITCAGSNGYRVNMGIDNGHLTNTVVCGDGETENMGGYPCEFYGTHPFNNFPIISMVQGTGDTLTVTVNTATNGVFYVDNTYRVIFAGVTGFANNPNGQFQVVKQINNGFYNSFTIIHNGGAGAFSSGNVSVFYQSYSHAYIAGQIAFIKDSLDCSWWEARYRSRMTASEGNIFATYNGYGKINILNAINYNLTIPADPYNTLGTPATITASQTGNTFNITIDTVTNTLKYVIYDNNQVLETIFANSFTNGTYSYNINRKTKSDGGIHYFYYDAIRGTEKIRSNKVRIPYLMHPRIAVVSQAPVFDTYYFSSQGSDSNSGLDSSNAFRTITRAQSLILKAGDILRFKGGDTIKGTATFFDDFSDTTNKVVFNSYGSGKAYLKNEANSVVFYFAFTGIIRVEFNNLIFQGSYNPVTQTGGSANSKGIWIDNADINGASGGDSMYVAITNCEFYNYYYCGIELRIMNAYKRGTYNILNNIIHNAGFYGISVMGIYYSNLNIVGNNIQNIYSRSGNDYLGYGINGFCVRKANVAYNYIYNCGEYADIGSAGSYFHFSKLINMTNNVVDRIHLTTFEGVGLYLDCGTDSSIIENNLVQNCEGFGIILANAPTSFCGLDEWFPGFVEDSLEASFNIARNNIIIGDSATMGGIYMYAKYQTGMTEYQQKRNMIYNNLFYMKGGYRFIDTSQGERLPAAIAQFGWSDSLFIFNNIFVLDSAVAIQHDILSGFGSTISNWIVTNNIYYQTNGLNNSIARQRTNSFNSSPFFWRYRTYSSISNWNDSTNFNTTYFNENPYVKNLVTDFTVSPYDLDTLLNFQTADTSISRGNGINLNDQVLRIADTATVDFYGTTWDYDIGQFQSTSTKLIAPKMDSRPIFSAVDTGYLWTVYNGVNKNPYTDSLEMWIIEQAPDSSRLFKTTSKDGITFGNKRRLTRSSYQAVIQEDSLNYSSLVHLFSNPAPQPRHYMLVNAYSTDGGVVWAIGSDTMYTGSKSVLSNRYTGEDVTVMYDPLTDSINTYFRDSTTSATPLPVRTIALTKTKDRINYSARQTVLPKTLSNYYNTNSKDYRTGFYAMAVCKTAPTEYWGFCYMFRQGGAVGADENPANPTGAENTLHVRLYFSEDGKDWQITNSNELNDTTAFINYNDTVKQIITVPYVNEETNEIWLYTILSEMRHNSNATYSTNFLLGGGDPNFYLWRHKISIPNIRKYKP